MAKLINSIRLLNLARQRVNEPPGNELTGINENPEGVAMYLAFVSIERLYKAGSIDKEARNETEANLEAYYQTAARRTTTVFKQAQKFHNELNRSLRRADYETAVQAALNLLALSEVPVRVAYNELYKHFKENGGQQC